MTTELAIQNAFTTSSGRTLWAVFAIQTDPDTVGTRYERELLVRFVDFNEVPSGASYYVTTILDARSFRPGRGLVLDGAAGESLTPDQVDRLRRLCWAAQAGVDAERSALVAGE